VAQITVVKEDSLGRELFSYRAALISEGESQVQLEGVFALDDVRANPVIVLQGDLFEEHFFSDRWYNIFVIRDPLNRQIRGWYCNLSYPAEIESSLVRWRDLALDLWVSPNGTTTVLDQDEYDDLDLDEGVKIRVRAALAELISLARSGRLPGQGSPSAGLPAAR